jgi:nicotinamidase-related amidase
VASALIVTDMLNRYEHDDAERLLESVADVVPRLSRLIAATREREMLVAYVNDTPWGLDGRAQRTRPSGDERCCRVTGGAAAAPA